MSKQNDQQEENVIKVITTEETTLRSKDGARRLVEEGIPLDKLRSGFKRFMGNLREIVTVEESSAGDFALEEITFSAEIGADGEFKLFGTGVGITASSAVSFTLRRKTSA